MQFPSLEGPFCRTCGVAAVRDMTTTALSQGWWGPLSLWLFTPLALLWNLVVWLRVTSLRPPGPHGAQLDPGRPVVRRPAAYVALLPIGFFVYVALRAGTA